MGRKVKYKFYQRCALVALALSVSIGCSGPQLVKFNETSYRNLTALKAEVLLFYDTLSNQTVDDASFRVITLKLAQMHEYEAGKGDGNIEMTQQIASIQKTFKRHVSNRLQEGPSSPTHVENLKEAIGNQFNIAIRTELAKNR